MFEKSQPVALAQKAPLHARVAGEDGASHPRENGAESLRPIAWTEVTARLNAARDLRRLLRQEAHAPSGHGGSFAEAAARYFRAREEDQPVVNPVALEHRKGSSGICHEDEGPPDMAAQFRGCAATGDARED